MRPALEAAIGYARQGWPVLPLWWPLGQNRCACGNRECASPGKHPHRFVPTGLKGATTDVEVVTRWFTEVPELNVGLRTGVAFDVLDLDRPEAGRWLADRAEQLGLDTDECWGWGPMSVTGHGHHLLYRPTGARNGSRLAQVAGFDWRGADGYIVAPPSRHHEGATYAWHPECGPETPIPDAPAFLAALARKERPDATRGAPAAATPAMRHLEAMATRRRGWSADGLIGKVAAAETGERNSILYWAARRVVEDRAAGRCDTRTADEALDKLNRAAVRSGLTDHEADRTIRSALGMRGAA